ncbi:MAG: DUF177 domain-containing protein [Ignavibacteriales bacterium]|nr:DUF177 domain-containing protein [Ignavibacteriales bacterium]
MIIKFSNFTDGVHTIEFDEPIKNINLDNPYKGNVVLLVKMDKSHSQIVLSCDVIVKAGYECDRCDENFESILESNFRLIYLITNNPQKTDELNLYYLSPEADKIDLKKDVREFIILSEPMKKLCKEDCKGLCSKCGANLNLESCNCKEENTENVFSSILKQKTK